MADKTEKEAVPAGGASFEAAIKRLEEVVQGMESGESSLDTMLALFQEGQELVKFCNAKLNEVEKKIEKLSKSDGEIKPVPFEPSEKEASK
ncbi:MAG: exodeoxyribonuclease VII small subunit [Kiritimatiellae bacterium]|nr:exodeoxyribonuclease VII small subunit [Kiritimatiellia bacterium]